MRQNAGGGGSLRPFTGIGFRAAAASGVDRRQADGLDWAADVPAFGLLVRMVVPGWTRRYAGHPTRGKCIFGCFLALFLPGLLFLGTALGSVLLGLALSLHAASIMDMVRERQGFRILPPADLRAGRPWGVVSCTIPPGGRWLLTRVASPLAIQSCCAIPFDARRRRAAESFRLPMV